MLFPDKSKRHQHLTQYLRHAAKRRTPVDDMQVFLPVFAGVFVVITVAAINSAWLLIGIAAAILVLLAARWQGAGKKKREPTAQQRLRAQAQPVIQTMLAHAEQKRLHRELDESTVALLEECARYYWQVQAVFNSPFWGGSQLPVSYQGVRESALRAADMTMDELMLLYQNSLPAQPQGTKPIEFVEDALEEYVFKKPRIQDFVPPTFEPTRKIAEKLRDLAQEADRVSHELVTEPNVPSIANPGGALDASIGDLRQIRQAEEELRQNLGG